MTESRAETDRSFYPSIFDLPFFEERHRRLAFELESWAAETLPACDAHGGDELQQARAIGRALAAGGWYRLLAADPDAAMGAPDVRSLCIARETLARHSGLADFVFALQGLGSASILLAGSEAQRRRYMPPVIAGASIPAFALTEAEAGSDAAAIRTRAEVRGDTYVLDGSKMWISNAGIADLYVVFARTGGEGAKGVSAFIVEADTPGLAVTEQIEVMAPHVLGALEFRDCRVPADRMIGKPGEGFKVAMTVLDIYRSTVGAAALGFAKRALQEVVPHVRKRRLFGQALAEFQATKMRLADMAADIDSASLLVYRSAWVKDVLGRRVSYESSLAKLAATEQAQKVIDSALQLFGAQGVRKGSVLETLYRDIRPLRIYEGATEIQKLIVADQMLRRWAELNEPPPSGGTA